MKLPTYVLTVVFGDGGKSVYKIGSQSKALEKLNILKRTDNVVSAEVTNGQSSLKVYSGRKV